MPFVYLLRCRGGTLYAGAAVDLARRLRQHAAGRASRYTRARLPVVLVWSLEVETWSAALVEEARIKKLRREEKLALIPARRRRRAASPSPASPTGRASRSPSSRNPRPSRRPT